MAGKKKIGDEQKFKNCNELFAILIRPVPLVQVCRDDFTPFFSSKTDSPP